IQEFLGRRHLDGASFCAWQWHVSGLNRFERHCRASLLSRATVLSCGPQKVGRGVLTAPEVSVIINGCAESPDLGFWRRGEDTSPYLHQRPWNAREYLANISCLLMRESKGII